LYFQFFLDLTVFCRSGINDSVFFSDAVRSDGAICDHLSALFLDRVSKSKNISHCSDTCYFPSQLPSRYFSTQLDASFHLCYTSEEPFTADTSLIDSCDDDLSNVKSESSFTSRLYCYEHERQMQEPAQTKQHYDPIYDVIMECETCEICTRSRTNLAKLAARTSYNNSLQVSDSYSSSNNDLNNKWFPPTPPIPHSSSDYEDLDVQSSLDFHATADEKVASINLAELLKPKRVRFSNKVDIRLIIRAEEQDSTDCGELVQFFAIVLLYCTFNHQHICRISGMLHWITRCLNVVLVSQCYVAGSAS